MSPLNLSITTRIISKKNSKQISFNRSTGRRYIRSNDRYKEFAEMAGWELKGQNGGITFTKPVFIDYHFFMKGKQTLDVDNAMASVNDVLEDIGILENDKLVTDGSFRIRRDTGRWGAELIITDLDSMQLDQLS